MAFMFDNLQVYQKAVDFADKIASHTENFPRGYYFLVDQLNRAALSVATNLAEGNGRFTKPDRKNVFTIARNGCRFSLDSILDSPLPWVRRPRRVALQTTAKIIQRMSRQIEINDLRCG
jgi:hypothetical protein